jgi:hypothetical protein
MMNAGAFGGLLVVGSTVERGDWCAGGADVVGAWADINVPMYPTVHALQLRWRSCCHWRR